MNTTLKNIKNISIVARVLSIVLLLGACTDLDENDVLYARDLSAENVKLINYYRGKKDFYLYRRDVDAVHGKLIKIDEANASLKVGDQN